MVAGSENALIIDNTYVFNNEIHEFLINTEYVDDGFELSLSIDGQEVISFVDDHDEIPEEGYVTFYCSVDRVEIMPVNPTLISTNSEADKISYDRITALKVGESKALFAGISSQIDEEDEKVVPKIVNTRAFVPIRFVVDALGGEVQWDEELQTARITYRMNEVSITEGFAEYGLNGLFHKLDAPPYIENSRLFVPLRVIAEAFNKNVIWTEEEIIFILEQEEELSDETKENIFDFFN